MNITNLFHTDKLNRYDTTRTENAGIQQPKGDAALLKGQVAPGDIVKGQIVGRDGQTVQVAVGDDYLFEARLGKDMNLELGRTISFEVKGNGQALQLSPLFMNTATETAVMKALDMASLPVNGETVALTQAMMKAGMSIGRNNLQQLFSEMRTNGLSDPAPVIDLHKLGLPVNENNLSQLENYRNLSHQIGEGMQQVAKDLYDLVDNLIAKGDDASAAKVMTGLLELAGELPEETVVSLENQTETVAGQSLEDGHLVSENVAGQKTDSIEQNTGNLSMASETSVNEPTSDAAKRALELLSRRFAEAENTTGSKQADGQNGVTIPNRDLQSTDSRAAALINQGNDGTAVHSDADPERLGKFTPELRENLRAMLSEQGQTISEHPDMKELFDAAGKALEDAITRGEDGKLHKLLSNPALKQSVFAALTNQWSITPEEVSHKEKVDALYQRLNRQLTAIAQTLEDAGQTKTPAFSSSQNMGGNLDFLNQVNQMYAYVQLPIRLSGGDSAHGDLYVYSNGKKMAGKDGKVSALLHLDMEHLGPVDVYVAMDTSFGNQKVSTQFTVGDDDLLDFLNDHMHLLTDRLAQKGYDCSCKMMVKGQNPMSEDGYPTQTDGGLAPLVDTDASIKLAEYSFDVRT